MKPINKAEKWNGVYHCILKSIELEKQRHNLLKAMIISWLQDPSNHDELVMEAFNSTRMPKIKNQLREISIHLHRLDASKLEETINYILEGRAGPLWINERWIKIDKTIMKILSAVFKPKEEDNEEKVAIYTESQQENQSA